ncbi:MAG: hypothetical protein IKP71_09180 [Candidatus Riflebacteria bacterium]|nr:hypothetical protein [Candidatus Riflebacteria bacterium]
MTKVICENCNLEIDVPEGYNAPYIQCPDCASIQKFVRSVKGEPRFKILDQKGRERANNKVVGEVVETLPPSQPTNTAIPKNIPQRQPVETNTLYKPLDKKQMILDSIGEDGLLKAYKLVGNYLWSTSDKIRKNGRAKAIRRMMKEKYPLEIASKAIEFAERSPEGLKYARQKLITMLVIIALIVVGFISVLLAFL